MQKVLFNYASLADVDENFKDINSFYLALIEFVKNNKYFFTNSINELWGLDELMRLDCKDYTVEYLGFDLIAERTHIRESIDYLSISSLPMIVRDKLWELITIYSDKDCPVCGSAFRYIKVIDESQNENILLECTVCTRIENRDGTIYKALGKVRTQPVKKQEIS